MSEEGNQSVCLIKTRLGKDGKIRKDKFFEVECPVCRKFRLVSEANLRKNKSLRCFVCSRTGEQNPHWVGGRIRQKNGYVKVKCPTAFESMADHQGYVLEHRIVMALHIGRPLVPSEQVHHRNGIKSDNSLDNLELMSLASHLARENYCKDCPLKKEVKRLKCQIQQMTQHPMPAVL